MSVFHPHHLFPQFYTNPAITSLAKNESWTISTNEKMPVDMVALINERTIRGAKFSNKLCLTTLDTITNNIPYASNVAYHLNAFDDKFLVIDIEPTAPISLVDKLIKIPHVYAETSMSGKGYHLLAPLPDNAQDFPHVYTKTKLRSPDGHFEFLLNQYCTFTRNHIIFDKQNFDSSLYCDIYADIAQYSLTKSKDLSHTMIDSFNNYQLPDNDDIDILLHSLSGKIYSKTVDDFDGDLSRYEFSYACFIAAYIKVFLKNNNTPDMLSFDDMTYIVYTLSKEFLPFRSKHDEYRGQLPWLIYNARNAVGLIMKDS